MRIVGRLLLGIYDNEPKSIRERGPPATVIVSVGCLGAAMESHDEGWHAR